MRNALAATLSKLVTSYWFVNLDTDENPTREAVVGPIGHPRLLTLNTRALDEHEARQVVMVASLAPKMLKMLLEADQRGFLSSDLGYQLDGVLRQIQDFRA
jgi:type IV secretory pathway VirD2 relaxase